MEENLENENQVTQHSPEGLLALTQRLNRVEGQIRGIKRMLENGTNCPDILIQVSAANAALHSFAKVLLTNHLQNRVIPEFNAGNDEAIGEFVSLLHKMLK